MRKTLILLSLMILNLKIIGQTIKKESELKEYFIQNALSLDPAEGIWSIEKCSWTGYYRKTSLGTNESTDIIGDRLAIVKVGEKLVVYSKSENYELTDEYYESKGMPGEYFCHQMFYEIPHSSNATMSNLFSLEHRVVLDYRANQKNEMFIAMAKQMKERNTYNFEMEMYFKYSKIFPTYSDYQNAPKSRSNIETSTGTGFAISSNGFIATNYHVVESAMKLNVRGINGDFSKSYNAKVILADKNNDLAIIQIDDKSFTGLGETPYAIKTTTADVGENINVLGFPLTATMGEEIKFTNGIISSKSGFQGDITCYQCSAPIQPGNSGGPMFDKSGNIIGIINAKHGGAENVSYAIKSTYLFNLIQSLPNPPKASVNTIEGKSLAEQIRIISKFVYIIEKS